MKTLLLSFTAIVIQLILSTYSDASNSSVFCKFLGSQSGYDYVFNINDTQNKLKFCDVMVYSTYYLDWVPAISTGDKDAITALVGIGKTVYILIEYLKNSGWSELLDPSKNGEVYNSKMGELVTFLSTYKINGAIMMNLPLYEPDSPVTTKQIADFANKLKEKVKNNLKVGMIIPGSKYQQFSNNAALDYGSLNNEIDYYFIVLTVLNYCNDKTKYSSINPIKSNDSSLHTLEERSIAVHKSAMEKSKVIAMLQVNAIQSVKYHQPQYDNDVLFESYSELCGFKLNREIVKWCSDYTDTFYKQGNFATRFYQGIMLAAMEGDDPYCHCNCEPFVVSNTITLGWKSGAESLCKGIDDLMGIV